jgi:hypothetical protein
MKIKVVDRISYAISSRTYTDEGFLKVPARVSRTGIQEYLASELGLTGDGNRIVKVYRPPEEVFSQASLDSFKGADITVEHPDSMVDANNYKSVSVGTTLGCGIRDGDFVLCELIIKDKDGIKAAEGGKIQVSVGYTATYDDNVPEGVDYEYIQREIRVNHIALVDRARAGAQARLFDKKPRLNNMAIIVLDSGKTIEVEDRASAQLVNDHIERLNGQIKQAEQDKDAMQAAKDSLTTDLENVKSELEIERKKSSDSAISEKIQTILNIREQARKIVGSDFVTDSLDEIEIKKEALKKLSPTKDWDDRTDAYVIASFDIAAEKTEEEEEESEDEMHEKKKSKDSYKQLAQDAAKTQMPTLGEKRVKSIDTMTSAWKTTAGDK